MNQWVCSGCGSLNNEELRYCSRCGSLRPSFNDGIKQREKGKSGAAAFLSSLLIIAALAISIILELSARPWAELNITSSAVTDSPKADSSSYAAEPYSIGAVADGVYTNRWAGIEFDVTEAFPEAADYVYDVYNSTGAGAEYGFISQDPVSGKSLLVCFEPVDDSITDFNYMDAFMESYIYGVELAGSTVDVYEYYYGVLAGNDYLVCCANIKENDLWEYICVRVYDGYAITVAASSADEDEVITTLNSIRSPS